MDPQSLRYTTTHEWTHLEGNVGTVGITEYAAEQLTDVTYIELPEVGKTVKSKEDCGKIETVKAVSDLYAPCDGTITEVNTKLEDDPNLITQDPLKTGWLFKIQLADGANLDHLLNWDQYQKQIAEEGH